jgi:hypothetical protein
LIVEDPVVQILEVAKQTQLVLVMMDGVFKTAQNLFVVVYRFIIQVDQFQMELAPADAKRDGKDLIVTCVRVSFTFTSAPALSFKFFQI